jgi:hypothetical protein
LVKLALPDVAGVVTLTLGLHAVNIAAIAPMMYTFFIFQFFVSFFRSCSTIL